MIQVFFGSLVTVLLFSTKHETNGVPKPIGKVFRLEINGNAFSPTDYIPGQLLYCPGDGKISVICVPLSDVYSAAEVVLLGYPRSYIGRPKVDDFSLNGLGCQVQEALITPGKVLVPVKGRLILEQN